MLTAALCRRLSHNRIERLEGFSPDDAAPSVDAALSSALPFSLPLTELHLSHQHLPPSSPGLTFSHASLIALPRLTFLDISHTRLADAALSSLSLLPSLTTLLATHNPLHSLPVVLRLLPSLPRLSSLDLRHCPVAAERRYRDAVVAAGQGRLRELDGKDVRGEESAWLMEMERRRGRRGRAKEERKEQMEETGQGSAADGRPVHADAADALGGVSVVGVATGYGGHGSSGASSGVPSRRGSVGGGRGVVAHSRTSSVSSKAHPREAISESTLRKK